MMRKSIFALFLPFAGLWTACSTEEEAVLPSEDIQKIVATIGASEKTDDSFTRANISDKFYISWKEGDTLGIFPSKGGQVEFPITTGFGESSAQFDGGGWALKQTFAYAAYCPYDHKNRNASQVPVTYIGQVQKGDNNRDHLGQYTFIASAPQEVQGSVVHLNFIHVGTLVKLKLTMPEAKTYTSLKIFETNRSRIFPIKKNINLLDQNLTQTDVEYADNLSLGLKNITTTHPSQTITCWMACPSVIDKSKVLKVVVYDKQGEAYVADIKTDPKNNPATVNFITHKYRNLMAYPQLQPGFNIGINDWENNGPDFGGTAH